MAESADDTTPTDALLLQPLVHVEDMSVAVRFYERLGGRVYDGSRAGDWVVMTFGDAQLGLLARSVAPQQLGVELGFLSPWPLQNVQRHLAAAGVTITQPITETAFGHQLQVRGPDGLIIKINQLGD